MCLKWWVCHGRRKWPENSVRLKSLLSGPTEELAGYIPDFGFELYDLVQFSDDEIKGTILSRMTMLLLKYVFDPKLHQKLPEIKGLKEAIELGMALKFPEDVNQVMADIRGIHDVEALLEIKEAIITAKKGLEILALAKSEGI